MKSGKEKPPLRSASLPARGPGVWQEEVGLRSTYLLFLDKKDVDSLIHLSRVFFLFKLEVEAPYPTYLGSHNRARLRAAMNDLQFLARYLAVLASDLNQTELPKGEAGFPRLADELAMAVEAIALRIHRATGRAGGKRKGR
ncbi:MAG TPA: hypothetical protein VLX28_25475 [Thermoanaerobaculia bacterium]|nr:hypothetical protein [Thermoanaerobaculia bacterium]